MFKGFICVSLSLPCASTDLKLLPDMVKLTVMTFSSNLYCCKNSKWSCYTSHGLIHKIYYMQFMYSDYLSSISNYFLTMSSLFKSFLK